MDNMKVRDTAKIFDSNDKAPYIKKANYELFFMQFSDQTLPLCC